MITIEAVCAAVGELERAEVERWIANAWLRAEGAPGAYALRDIDVARVHLIHELRRDLGLDDDVLPLVLSLLDQLYDMRRRMARLSAAIGEAAPEDVRREIARVLSEG